MGSTLTNGIYLPAEGERNCYEGLAANWTALDGLIGGYNAHVGNATIHVTAADKQAWNGKADASALTAHTGDTTIHVTAEDKQAWNGKADASALTAHTGNTTIHVTAEDKQAWNGKADNSALTAHTGDTTIHVTAEDKEAWNGKADASALTAHTGDTTIHVTAEDKQAWNGKADDADVVHKSGDETIIGSKRFGLVQSFTGYPSIRLYSSTDDVTVVPSYTQQQDIRYTDKNNNIIAYFIFQHRTDANEPFRTCWRQVRLDGTDSYYSVNFNNLGEFYPENNNGIKLGTSTKRWKDCQTYQINGLTPSSLSLPNNKGYVDISGYFTNTGDGQTNSYTASANGWIYLNVTARTLIMQIRDSNDNVVYADMCNRSSDGTIYMTIPISSGNKLLTQWFTSSSVTVATARFIPCQGNV